MTSIIFNSPSLLPILGWDSYDMSTTGGDIWYRESSTGTAIPGYCSPRSLPVYHEDTPDLRLHFMLTCPEQIYFNPKHINSAYYITQASITGTVGNKKTRIPLGIEDARRFLPYAENTLLFNSLISAYFHMNYIRTIEPNIFDTLTPAGPAMSAQLLCENMTSWGTRRPWPGVHYPPGLSETDLWETCTDQPFLMFSHGRKREWHWVPNSVGDVAATARWDDAEGIRALVAMTENPEIGYAYAWSVAHAIDDLG